ncbi:TPM domain-containing protein [Pelomonas sp. SE-A7]|uniref:TPM domain-containing protein n=1 Tax=Pelomonas sp. SE-A7 TaxID=3054953 RepID=UPI00259CDF92|nr:TPM domain-containing protein [Pelomonas sp. SE-A7]MDM4768107.1 TPM domain-containing protein [Pelomonas sp. SE-A7]
MRWLLTLLLLLCQVLPGWAQELRPVPVLTGRVIDQTGTLDALQLSSLDAKLAAFEQQAGPQIVILMLPSTAPEDIAAYAQRVGDAWKLGRREVGDGLLIVVAKNDRKVRIEVAKALEGAVPDLAARQIIQNAITPAFKKGDYAGGLNQAVDQLQARIRGEALPAPKIKPAKAAASSSGSGGFDWETLALIFFIGVPLVGGVMTSIMGRKLGSLTTSAGVGGVSWLIGHSLWIAGFAALLALILIGVMGIGSSMRRGRSYGGGSDLPFIWGGHGGGGGGSWSGGGGGGSDGGGFSSGGGGDFGGGGASGDW